MGFLLSLGVVVILLITPFIRSYDLVLTLLPLLYGLSLLSQTRGRAAMMLKAFYWGTLVILPWMLSGLVTDHVQESVQLWLVPLAVLALHIVLPLIQSKHEGTLHPLL
jgi:hypothetical protein